MNSSDYNKYLAAIRAANDAGDKAAMIQIKKRLIAQYGVSDDDANYLMRQFRYTI